jgi:hypothetical protein
MAALSEEVYRLSNSGAGNSEELKKFLEAHPGVDVNLHNSDSAKGSLHAAAGRNNAASTRLLIDANADLEARDKMGWTPLNLASQEGNLDCVQVLIESEADVKTADDDDWTPAHISALKGLSKCLSLLIDANADLEARNAKGLTPLQCASQEGNVDCVKVLIESKADVQTANNFGSTPAHSTALMGHSKCLSLLIDANTDVNARILDGLTPTMFACLGHRLECLQLLVHNQADLSMLRNDGKDSLYCAMCPPPDEDIIRVPGMPFAVLSCNTDFNNVLIDRFVTQAMVTAHVDEFKQIHAFIDKWHTITEHALSQDVVVDKRVGRGDNGLYHEPLERILEYLGMSMDKDQTVNTSIDGNTVKRALIPGQPINANLWLELHQRSQLVEM